MLSAGSQILREHIYNTMPVKPNFNPDYLYFVTTSTVKHAHLFRRDVIKRIIVDSLHHLRTTDKMKLFVFVIMPNHIHIIALFSEDHPLSDVMRDFKKFTARQIYRQFQAKGNSKVLEALRREGESLKQEYKVWEDGYDAATCFPWSSSSKRWTISIITLASLNGNLWNCPKSICGQQPDFILTGNPVLFRLMM